MLVFLDSTDELEETHRTLHTVFSSSYSKGDGTPASVSVELAALHAAALSAWSLLLTVVDIHAFSDPSVLHTIIYYLLEGKTSITFLPTVVLMVGYNISKLCFLQKLRFESFHTSFKNVFYQLNLNSISCTGGSV